MRAWRSGGVFNIVVLDERPGAVTLRVSGDTDVFRDEAGGHLWQRVPPTERRGRYQTSTITVAVLPEPPDNYEGFSERDVEITAARGHGKGGQHRNKTESAIVARHLPTGLQAYCQSERSQHQNKAAALAVLRARVFERDRQRRHGDLAAQRRQQVGSGQRGDKRRTIRVRDNRVEDHQTGRVWRYDSYARGEW